MAQMNGFKPYHQGQEMLLPLSLEEFVPPDHKAHIISAVVDKMDLSCLYSSFCTDNGQNAYDPRMLTKVIFYATFTGIFSSREIENRLLTDTVFMYLAAMQKPSYRTIIRFKSRFLKELVPLFEQIVIICQELELVGLNHIAFDGTKIKANASPKKSLTEKQLQRRIRKLLKLSVKTDKEEDEIFDGTTPFAIPEDLAKDAELMKKIEQLTNAYTHLTESDDKRVNLTDEDAKIMKSKQTLIPAYNAQTAVDDKFHVIVGVDVTTEETDHHQLIPMVEQVIHNTKSQPEVISADPGYATYENYEYLANNGLYALIPDTMHFIDTQGRSKYYTKSRFRYDKEKDSYVCPAGRTMNFVRMQKSKKGEATGIYRGDCTWCPLHQSCTKSSFRTITRHPKESLKDSMRDRLSTPEGKKEYGKRITVAEAPFGDMKANKRWNQLSYRGNLKVKGECILHVIGHNLGIICRNVPVERVENLDLIPGSSGFSKNDANNNSSSSFSDEILGMSCCYDSMSSECHCGFVKNEFRTIGSGFAM